MNRFLLVLALAAACTVLARAQSANVDVPVGSAPVIRIQFRTGTIAIRTWNRESVQVTSDGPVETRRFAPEAVDRVVEGDIPIFATRVRGKEGTITLPAEEFPLAPLPAGAHEGIMVHAIAGNATVFVPADAALVIAGVGRGTVEMSGYRNGTFVVRVHAGGIRLQNVSGSGYVEAARGPIVVAGSSFDRVRARTALGSIVFQDCRARQIEVSSVDGSIAYDNGSFGSGVARFESQNGNVGIGVADGGNAQISVHAPGGDVRLALGPAAFVHRSGGDAQLTVGKGSTVVTASSAKGSVAVYSGSYRAHARLVKGWRLQEKLPKYRHVELKRVLR